MKTNLMYLAAALLLAACSPKASNMTKIVAQFGDDAPESARIVTGAYNMPSLDTIVSVKNGRLEAEIPKNLGVYSNIFPGTTTFQEDEWYATFLSDGSTITIDPEAHTAVSSDKEGYHSRYAAYNGWMDDYRSDMQAKMKELADDKEALDAYRDERSAVFFDYQRKIAKENADSYTGMMAIVELYFGGKFDGLLDLVDGLSDEVKTDAGSSIMIDEITTRIPVAERTAVGKPFVDFTVVQDPEHPETSTVKLSDYVGKGKFILIDFWASWCGPCMNEMPNLVKLYNTYHGDKFDMVSIPVSAGMEASVAASKDLGIVWNQIINAPDTVLTDLYGIMGIPHTILFSPDGTILGRDLVGAKLEEAVKEALGV